VAKPRDSKDITRLIKDWEFQHDKVVVRIVPGDDGKDKIQLRVEMGLLQMEMSGRPDGRRPQDCDSWLDYYENEQRTHDEAHPDSAAYQLEDEACVRLWREGVQYYQRYLSLWHLEQFDLCARDTARNLRLLDFVRSYADDDRQKLQFEQYRPYVTMMHHRAAATPMVLREEFPEALERIEAGIDAIRDFLEEYGQSERAEECIELVNLEQWREEVLEMAKQAGHARPESPLEALRRRLNQAIAAERFEEAAELRDEIRRTSRGK
jgi:hypothetical protein